MGILDKINSPNDLKYVKNLNFLAEEIRNKIIKLVSENGGHLASNLGVIELTIAVLRVFFEQENNIVWDVGHQCYAFKMLTGRFKNIDSIRKKNGISGFSNKKESQFDKFTTGHSSVAISTSLGLSIAGSLNKCNIRDKNHKFFIPKTVAIVGDGAMTGGISYEGMNNASRFGKNFLLILNDNKMSISKNVGSISSYFTKLRVMSMYLNTKRGLDKFLGSVPIFGSKLKQILVKSRQTIKTSILRESTIFEDMGFVYYGPIDGHDIYNLINILEKIKKNDKPVLLHVVTKKGKGYKFAENDPNIFHGINKFDCFTGISKSGNIESFSSVMGKELCSISAKNQKIYVITAAMTRCLGLEEYEQKFPERFADVGIAESHAVAFAAGLAAGGMIPIFCVYSTFLQRTIDQIVHDVSMQNLKVIFNIDRAGLVGNDGESHQGIFDISLLNIIPNLKIYVPSYFTELKNMLNQAISDTCSVAIRYPKGGEFYKPKWIDYNNQNFEVYSYISGYNSPIKITPTDNFLLNSSKKLLVISYGRIFLFLAKILEEFKENHQFCLLKLNVIKPIDMNSVDFVLNFRKILFFEEHINYGGVGEKFASNLVFKKFTGEFKLVAINESFVEHAEIDEQLKKFFIDYDGMKKNIIEFW
ncbi:MAG: 1-deoxy-D-xylulose-5-phosphate synthase [Candidatus Improbicoccus devescovinae]|nr:MAG: 1-deoxy-D-xylulose-5-phosphate synthase [Candidatus Improbicoccus devescovinae]